MIQCFDVRITADGKLSQVSVFDCGGSVLGAPIWYMIYI